MKKQFTKIKIAAENLSRASKYDFKDCELENIEKQVDKYKDVLDKMLKKLPSFKASDQERIKQIKKNDHYKTGQALEESAKELQSELPLHRVLSNCGELEKCIAEYVVDSEIETECEVVKKLRSIVDGDIHEIFAYKRKISKIMQEYASTKRSFENALRVNENESKIHQFKLQQEQCEIKLEKERDYWAALMFELLGKEDIIIHCIKNFVLSQKNLHEKALLKVNSSLLDINEILQSSMKHGFGISLLEHLTSSNRQIAYIIELCVCFLTENGLYEEGLLRVSCASAKLRRMKHALEAQYVGFPLPTEYQNPHVVGSILKLYLRELPEPLLTFKFYSNFIKAAEKVTQLERKLEIKYILNKLPKENFENLKYLTKFLWLVAQNMECNKMSSQNLAIVMSPNLLWPQSNSHDSTDYIGQVNTSSAINVVIELLISQWEFFFDSAQVDFFISIERNKLSLKNESELSNLNEQINQIERQKIDNQNHESMECKNRKSVAPTPPQKSVETAKNLNLALQPVGFSSSTDPKIHLETPKEPIVSKPEESSIKNAISFKPNVPKKPIIPKRPSFSKSNFKTLKNHQWNLLLDLENDAMRDSEVDEVSDDV